MEALKLAFLRVKALFTRTSIERDMDKEMRLHLDLLAEKYQRDGMPADEARKAAARRFGNLTRLKETGGDVRGGGILEAILRDVRHALRGFRRTPGFAITVVMMLALGIGANTAIFCIVDRLLLRPLPYPNGDQLVMVNEVRVNPSSPMSVSPANWLDWQRLSTNFESLAGMLTTQATITGAGDPEQVSVQVVTYEFFPMLGVPPLLGRTFVPEEDRPGAAPRIVISYALWQRKFAGDEGIVGKTIEVDGTAAEVIGVMPAGFRFLSPNTQIWAPFQLDRALDWRSAGGRFLVVAGRLKPSVTQASAQIEMSAMARQLEELHPFNKNSTFTLVSLRERLTGQVRASLLVLFAAVGVLLLIACLNVTNLLLARSASRRREIAIRVALGAGKWAIVRQLAAESLLIALSGGIAAVFVANWGVDLLLALAPANLLLRTDVPIDGWVLLYTFGISLLAGILVAVMPAGTTMRHLANQIRDGGRTATRSIRLRQGLIVGQVSMTVVLLCGAGLLTRSLASLSTTDTGVRTGDVLSLRVGLPRARYMPLQRVEFFRQAVERLQRLPGVQSVGAGAGLPVIDQEAGTGVHVQGEPELPMSERPSAAIRIVAPGYFRTLGIPVLQGREFSDSDQREDAPLVFLVNESFAELYLPGRNPLTTSISVQMQSENPHSPIVGVVGDVKQGSLRDNAKPTVFYNHMQLSSHVTTVSGMVLFIRGERKAGIAEQATEMIRDMDKNVPITELRWLDDALNETLARERLNAVVSGVFGLSALLLAALGLYGLLSFVVAERTKEIGVRMALGARASTVLRMVMNHGLGLVAIGVGIGLIGAFAMSRFIETLLFGITPYDPVTFVAIPGLLFGVSVLATLVPARRATKVDPLAALRQD